MSDNRHKALRIYLQAYMTCLAKFYKRLASYIVMRAFDKKDYILQFVWS